MATTYLDVKYRLGEIEPAIGTGSDAIISNFISGCLSEVNEWTNSAMGIIIDNAVADYAAAMVVDSMMGKSVVIDVNLPQMATNFRDQGKRRLQSRGFFVKYKKVE